MYLIERFFNLIFLDIININVAVIRVVTHIFSLVVPRHNVNHAIDSKIRKIQYYHIYCLMKLSVDSVIYHI